jgi:hypothetical protein
MTRRDYNFQPGAVLHEAIIGAFRASGTSLHQWCEANGVLHSVVRQSTFGQSQSEAGRALLERIIEAAGEDFVRLAYEQRMLDHAGELRGRRA